MSLLFLPIVLTIGGYWLTGQQEAQQQRLEDQRAASELHLAEQVAQDDALQAYLDEMSELIQAHDLLTCETAETACWETLALAQARTESVIQRLDADHNQSVVRFLAGADLLGKESLLGDDPTELSLFRSADLSGTDLERTDLRDVVLRESELSQADLHQAYLVYADLGGADLTGADLSNAYLQGAYLDYTDLSNADLSDADLRNVDLAGADLTDADLSGADLAGADLTDADLTNADLRGANLEGAYKYDYLDEGGPDYDPNRLITRAELELETELLEGATMPNEESGEDGDNAEQRGPVAFTDPEGTTIEVSSVPPGWIIEVDDEEYTLTVQNRNAYAEVIVSSEPIDPDIDTQEYAEHQGDLLQEDLPGYHVFTYEQTNVFGGDLGFRRVYSWDPEDGPPITQIQQYYAENSRGYKATATAYSSEIARYEPEMRQVLVNTTLIR
jgi:uncharacterized protein YjbI with pentapeptide repeats